MLWNDIAKLISIIQAVDAYGDTVETKTEKQVFVNKKSIRQSEYYQALSVGLKPEIMLEVKSIDYADEKVIEYNSKPYNITRAYSKNGEVTELICEKVI
ncbi:MAG TPA: phage head closure protein [Tissierellaceae bacterium]|nr:phage head closure protein [Tissierellaceae bacterium]